MRTPATDAPIGVFDSGVGGLSVLRALRAELPEENFIYVADSAHAPYGDRPERFIAERAAALVDFLVAQNVKAIVVACNTVTVVAVQELRSWCPVPVVAMEPAIKPAALGTKSGIVGVLATSQTLASPSVAQLCAAYGTNVRIMLQACPGLVEQVERGETDGDVTRALLTSYLAPLLDAGADTIVLGCTHYPFLGPLIRERAGPDVAIVDPGAAVARELARRLGANRRVAPQGQPAEVRFYSTGPVQQASSVMSALLGIPVDVLSL